MTIGVQNRNDYIGNGSTIGFPYTFKIFEASDLVVTQRNGNGVEETLLYPTDYSVSNVGNMHGGHVTLMDVLPDGVVLTIRRVRPITQTTDLRNQSAFFAEVHEDEFDHEVMIDQQLQDQIDRSIKVGETMTGIDTMLPTPKPNEVLVWNGNADGLTSIPAAAGLPEGSQSIAGDVTMSGDLYVGTDATIEGDLTVGGTLNADVNFLQAGAGAQMRTVQDRLRDTVSVLDFGAVGDGVADDTAKIQAAVNSLVAKGGALYFPTGLYRITNTITVSSLHPIHLVGRMDGSCIGPTVVTAGLVLGAHIAGPMVRYTAPNPADRFSCGGGNVESMAFFDCTNRGFSCTAALDLNDYPMSRVMFSVFEWIRGSAIKGELLVMSEIYGNVIRYCGDTGKPAMHFPSTTGPYVAQSLRIAANRIEANYGSSYVNLGALAETISVSDNRFEADTLVPDTNQYFLSVACSYLRAVNNNFNRNSQIQVNLAGRNNVVLGNIFRGGAFSTPALIVSGSLNSIVGNSFASTRTGVEVRLSGSLNTLSANTFFFSGSIESSAPSNVISGNTLHQLQAQSAILGAGNAYWINLTATALFNVVAGNIVDNNAGPVTDVGGIRAAAPVCTVSNNSVRGFAGTGPGAHGIRCEQNQLTVAGNVLNAAALSIPGFYDSAFGNNVSDSALPLYAEATWDPGTVPYNAASALKTVAVPGAANGDRVSVSVDYFVDRVVVQAFANVNEVYLHLLNFNPSTITPGPINVKVRVFKKWN